MNLESLTTIQTSAFEVIQIKDIRNLARDNVYETVNNFRASFKRFSAEISLSKITFDNEEIVPSKIFPKSDCFLRRIL